MNDEKSLDPQNSENNEKSPGNQLSPKDDDSLSELSGEEKVAILLASLGVELAGKILQGLELSESASTRILEQVATMERVSPERVEEAIKEGIQYLRGAPTLDNVRAGPGYVRTLLAASYGDRKSREMLRRMSESSEVLRRISKEGSSIFKFVGEEHVEEMVSILKDEHPQTAALILGHLDNSISGQILIGLPLDMQKDVVRRLSKIKSIDLETISEVEEMLKQKLGIEEGKRRGRFHGIGTAADILTASNKETQDRVLEQLTEEDHELAQELERELFRFESLARVDDKELMRVLQNIEPETIAYAIRGISDNLRNKILRNLPKLRQERVNEEMQTMPERVLIRDVEDAQQNIVSVAQEMANEGEITLVFDESEYI